MKRLLLLLALPLSLCAILIDIPPSTTPQQREVQAQVAPEESTLKKKASSRYLWRNLYNV